MRKSDMANAEPQTDVPLPNIRFSLQRPFEAYPAIVLAFWSGFSWPTGACPAFTGSKTARNPPLKLNDIWTIRTRLQLTTNVREPAMFNLAIDSKLRACDLTRLRVQAISVGSQVGDRATVMQQKTQRPVQFEITEQPRQSVQCWIHARGLKLGDYLFPSRLHASPHRSTRQYARIVVFCSP